MSAPAAAMLLVIALPLLLLAFDLFIRRTGAQPTVRERVPTPAPTASSSAPRPDHPNRAIRPGEGMVYRPQR